MAYFLANSPRLRLAYNIFRWANLALLVLLLVLLVHKSPPPEVTRDPGAAARVEQKFLAAEQARAAGQAAAPVELDATELNSYLAENLQLPAAASIGSTSGEAAARPAPGLAENVSVPPGSQPSLAEVESNVRDVKINLEGDLIEAYVVFNLHGEDLSLELQGHLAADGGFLKFDPVEGKIGSLPLPHSALDAAVNQLMGSAENRDKLKLPDDIADIRIQNGQVVISYR